jgi:hypothetical protein
MPGATPEGAPYPLGGEPASQGDDAIALLATWVGTRPGVQRLNTAQKLALTSPDLWDGKLVYDTDEDMLFTYDLANLEWVPAGINDQYNFSHYI